MMWIKIFYSPLIISFFFSYFITFFFAIDSIRVQSTVRTSLAMAYILMALMTLMMMMNMLAILMMSMRNMLAILMLFHLDIPNISHIFFPQWWWWTLRTLVTRDGTPCARSIFDEYILLHDPYLIFS